MENKPKTAAETDAALREALHQMSDEDLMLLGCKTKPILFHKNRFASWAAGMSPLLAFVALAWMTKDPMAGIVAGALCFLPTILWQDAESHWKEWERAALEFHNRLKANATQSGSGAV